jgi:Tfp pilus assembly PilM family ATPase
VANSRAVFFASITGNISGDQINSSIARELKISETEAENLKSQVGLNRSANNQPLFFASIPMITSIKDEIFKRFDYWQTRNELGVERGRISRVVLCGGQSSLPGLVDFLQSYFDVPVELGNPWRNFWPSDKGVPDLSQAESLRFSTAIGLSLRSYDEIF